jgi:hypothetical protein
MERSETWMEVAMDENAIKVIASFTPVGEWWPVGAWIVTEIVPTECYWHKISKKEAESARIRLDHEISELEANNKGWFRNEHTLNNHHTSIKTSTDKI